MAYLQTADWYIHTHMRTQASIHSTNICTVLIVKYFKFYCKLELTVNVSMIENMTKINITINLQLLTVI